MRAACEIALSRNGNFLRRTRWLRPDAGACCGEA
jgi:hypothetical protein